MQPVASKDEVLSQVIVSPPVVDETHFTPEVPVADEAVVEEKIIEVPPAVEIPAIETQAAIETPEQTITTESITPVEKEKIDTPVVTKPEQLAMAGPSVDMPIAETKSPVQQKPQTTEKQQQAPLKQFKTEAVTQKPTEGVSSDKEAADATQLLLQARQAYWKNNMDESEKYYRSLAALEPQDPNVYGELGNVYYAQGKWQQAAESYYEAALRLLETGKKDQVNYLHRVIKGLDTDSAEKLAQKLKP